MSETADWTILRAFGDWGGLYNPRGELVDENHDWADAEDHLFRLGKYGFNLRNKLDGTSVECLDVYEDLGNFLDVLGYDRCPKTLKEYTDILAGAKGPEFT